MSISEAEKLKNRRRKQELRRLKRDAAKKKRHQEAENAKRSPNEEIDLVQKKQPPPPPIVKIPIRRLLDQPLTLADNSLTPKGNIWYTAKELKVLYPWLDKAPDIAPQPKSLGGQCGYQAHYNLMNSIDSIAMNPNPKQKRFFDSDDIRSMMSSIVRDQLALMENDKIPCNTMRSRHLYPGDVDLKTFSVHAFLAMGKKISPYRYKEMKFPGGRHYGLLWLLRQTAGYFIVYGNRLPLEDAKKNAFQDSFHYLAVNIKKKLVIDNKSSQAFLRLSQEAFDLRLKTVHTILALEKKEGDEWKLEF